MGVILGEQPLCCHGVEELVTPAVGIGTYGGLPLRSTLLYLESGAEQKFRGAKRGVNFHEPPSKPQAERGLWNKWVPFSEKETRCN